MKNENIKFNSKFKNVNLFNQTLHIILYPEDGLKTTNKLLDIKEGQKVIISVKPV